MGKLIECQKLTKNFARIKAIDSVDLSVEPGQTLGLVGPNGAGKTTLFSLISGYIKPTSGEIRVFGHNPSTALIKGRIGALPQDTPFLQGISVEAQLSLYAKLQGYTGKAAKVEVSQVLEHLKIIDLARQYPETLSFGQRKRVSIAQTLIGKPELILLDEPTSGLDPVAANDVRKIIREMGSHCTFIISSHNLDEIDDVCTEVIIIKQGKLVKHCPISELVERDSSLNLLLSHSLPDQAQKDLNLISDIDDVMTDPANPHRVTISFNSENPDQLQLEIMSTVQKHNVSIIEFSRGETLTGKVVNLVKG
ncbi:MAG: ABC transporter ATP-binding protein [Gammaproteobacteria bacterium]